MAEIRIVHVDIDHSLVHPVIHLPPGIPGRDLVKVSEPASIVSEPMWSQLDHVYPGVFRYAHGTRGRLPKSANKCDRALFSREAGKSADFSSPFAGRHGKAESKLNCDKSRRIRKVLYDHGFRSRQGPRDDGGERELDCVVVTPHDNVYYATGSDIMTISMLKRLVAVFIPLDGEPTFGVHAKV